MSLTETPQIVCLIELHDFISNTKLWFSLPEIMEWNLC